MRIGTLEAQPGMTLLLLVLLQNLLSTGTIDGSLLMGEGDGESSVERRGGKEHAGTTTKFLHRPGLPIA